MSVYTQLFALVTVYVDSVSRVKPGVSGSSQQKCFFLLLLILAKKTPNAIELGGPKPLFFEEFRSRVLRILVALLGLKHSALNQGILRPAQA